MDTTPEYITMCIKATPDILNSCSVNSSQPISLVWGQEVLQEIARDGDENNWSLSGRFTDFIFQTKYGHGYRSMDMSWLAFVMKTKYGKVWKGEEWVKI